LDIEKMSDVGLKTTLKVIEPMKILPTESKHCASASACGFTLMESMVAIALGAIMVSALYASFASGFATVRAARENLRATQVLVKRVESVHLCAFDQITNTIYNPPTFTEYYDPQGQSDGKSGIVYNGTFTPSVPAVGSLPEAYRADMLLITFGLSWTSGRLQHTRSIQTYVARDGIEGYVSIGQ